MFFYLLQTATKSTARQTLKSLATKINSYSSIYYYDKFLYIIFATANKLLENICSLPETRLIACQFSSEPKEENAIIANWGISELKQDINFINYENTASFINDGCYLVFGNSKIIRSFQPLTEIMLIINNTPDSFSEQGEMYHKVDKIIQQVENSLIKGVEIIDIGAESTRPYATYIDSQDEISRLKTIIYEISKFKNKYSFKLSLDSYKAETIKYFLADIDIINDVSGKLATPILKEIAINKKIYLVMHSLTIPTDKNILIDQNINPLTTLKEWGENKIAELLNNGFTIDQIILDIGIGFNKNAAQSWYLLKHIASLNQLGVELLVGHSRKLFLNKVTENDFSKRDFETAIISNYLCSQMVDYLRIHDIDEFYRINNINNQLNNNTLYANPHFFV